MCVCVFGIVVHLALKTWPTSMRIFHRSSNRTHVMQKNTKHARSLEWCAGVSSLAIGQVRQGGIQVDKVDKWWKHIFSLLHHLASVAFEVSRPREKQKTRPGPRRPISFPAARRDFNVCQKSGAGVTWERSNGDIQASKPTFLRLQSFSPTKDRLETML